MAADADWKHDIAAVERPQTVARVDSIHKHPS
jgi:hypothetical protein